MSCVAKEKTRSWEHLTKVNSGFWLTGDLSTVAVEINNSYCKLHLESDFSAEGLLELAEFCILVAKQLKRTRLLDGNYKVPVNARSAIQSEVMVKECHSEN